MLLTFAPEFGTMSVAHPVATGAQGRRRHLRRSLDQLRAQRWPVGARCFSHRLLSLIARLLPPAKWTIKFMSVPTATFLAFCTAIAPAGACRAEVAGGYALHVADEYPAWATSAWVEYAAYITASESRNVPSSNLPIACTLVRDVTLRGHHPWRLYGNPGRWHGWGVPDTADYAAVRTALGGGCEDVPNFRYIGNLRDLDYFQRMGWVSEQPLSLYVGNNGRSTVVGVP